MLELKITNERNSDLVLTSSSEYTLYRVDGLTPVKANISSSNYAGDDGTIITGRRSEGRNIVLYIKINSPVEENRNNLYFYLSPKSLVTITIKTGLRTVHTRGIVETFECDIFSNSQRAQVSILCEDSYFTGEDDIVIDFTKLTNGFRLPVDMNNVEIGTLTTVQKAEFMYKGTKEVGYVMTCNFTANRNGFIFTVNDKYFSISYSFKTGDILTISTIKGNKIVTVERSGIVKNLLLYADRGSYFQDIRPGKNVIKYETKDNPMGQNCKVAFVCKSLYGGI